MEGRDISNSNDFLKRIEGKNINFLLGSGASMPYLGSLKLNKKIKESLEDIYSMNGLSQDKKQLILLIFFELSVKSGLITNKTLNSIGDTNKKNKFIKTNNNYKRFVNLIINLLSLQGFEKPKRANIFTTNYDTFLESAFDYESLRNPLMAFNDGSRGFIERTVNYRNYYLNTVHSGATDYFKREIPSINLYKLHGSLSWINKKDGEKKKDQIIISDFKNLNISRINSTVKKLDQCSSLDKLISLVQCAETTTTFVNKLDSYINSNNSIPNLLDKFEKAYSKLLIVSPNKRKFYDTVFENQYYQMLRAFANELEKKNSVLIVLGFSFKDKHILDILQRSITNPTLQIFVVAYKEEDKIFIESRITQFNSHVYFIKKNKRNGDFCLLNEFLDNQITSEQQPKEDEECSNE